MNNVLTRRHFLKASALTSGGLMLEITLSGAALGEALGTRLRNDAFAGSWIHYNEVFSS